MSAAPQEAAGPSWFQQARALLAKDIRAELRTKVALSSVGLFTFAALFLIGLATVTLKDALTVTITRLPDTLDVATLRAAMHPAWQSSEKMALLWVLLCFAAFAGLSHSFVHEEEAGTVTALRLSIRPGAVYAGKLAFNLILVCAIAAFITPFYMLLTGLSMGNPAVFMAAMASGCIGLAGVATIIAALTARAHGTAALYGALGLPMLAVFVLLLLNAAETAYVVDAPPLRIVRAVGGLLSFGILIIAISAMVFSFIWED